MPSVPDWVRKPTRPGQHVDGGERRVQLDRRIGADEPERLGTDQAHALAAGPVDQRPLGRLAGRPDPCSPALITTRACTRLRAHWSTTASTSWAGTAMTARSTSWGMSSTVG